MYIVKKLRREDIAGQAHGKWWPSSWHALMARAHRQVTLILVERFRAIPDLSPRGIRGWTSPESDAQSLLTASRRPRRSLTASAAVPQSREANEHRLPSAPTGRPSLSRTCWPTSGSCASRDDQNDDRSLPRAQAT